MKFFSGLFLSLSMIVLPLSVKGIEEPLRNICVDLRQLTEDMLKYGEMTQSEAEDLNSRCEKIFGE